MLVNMANNELKALEGSKNESIDDKIKKAKN